MPISATKIGVSELKIAASELSIFLAIADAKRNAGSRLPVTPDKMMINIFFQGILAI